ncbi:MAG: hypothetical protein NVSMB4_12190 [Acidimicrobiales bacterium]
MRSRPALDRRSPSEFAECHPESSRHHTGTGIKQAAHDFVVQYCRRQIHPSARRHGIADEDIRHAIEYAITKRSYGRTKSGQIIDDALIKKLADEAEAGYDVAEIIARRGQRGRPRLGSAPSTVESVRLDPELKERLARRAEDEGVPASEIIRQALREHLEAS